MKNIIIIVLIVVFMSCDTTEPIDNHKSALGKYLPLEYGNMWNYKVSDPYANQSFNFERTITTNINHQDGTNIWGYKEKSDFYDSSSNNIIRGYYAIKNDGIYYYRSDKDTMNSGMLTQKILLLKTPIELGTSWITESGKNSRIVEIQDIEVQGHTYKDAALVEAENEYQIDSTWFVPEIGMVKKVIKIFNTPYRYLSDWELRSYELK